MQKLQSALDDILASSPEMSFFEASTALEQRGLVTHAELENPGVHAYVYQLYQRAKGRANTGRINPRM